MGNSADPDHTSPSEVLYSGYTEWNSLSNFGRGSSGEHAYVTILKSTESGEEVI